MALESMRCKERAINGDQSRIEYLSNTRVPHHTRHSSSRFDSSEESLSLCQAQRMSHPCTCPHRKKSRLEKAMTILVHRNKKCILNHVYRHEFSGLQETKELLRLIIEWASGDGCFRLMIGWLKYEVYTQQQQGKISSGY